MKTKRAELKFIAKTDFAEVLNMFHEPDTFKYIAPLMGKTEEEYEDILKSKITENEAETGFYWIARLTDTGEFVGAMNLNPRRDTGRIQLGFQIRRKFWGQGFATELSKAVLDFAQHDRGMEMVFAVFVDSHIASRKVLTKLGFEPFEQRVTGEEWLEVYKLEF